MKNTIYTVVGVVVLVLAIAGGYMFPRVTTIIRAGAVSTSGTYNNTTFNSQIIFNPLTSTSTSILNTGASDRAIENTVVYCTAIGNPLTYLTGAGLASWTLLEATTTTSGNGLQGNTNYIANMTIATTSNSYIATTTEGVLYAYSRYWPVNTYMTFNFNATTTGSCSIEVGWLPL